MPANEFVISRTFDAPRERVWDAFAEAGHLEQWWGPKGCALEVAALDFKPGGLFHYAMKMPNGGAMWGRFAYHEIAKPERIVFVNSFSNPQGGVTRHPLSETWPLEMLSTITFAEQGRKTELTLRGIPLNATEAEIATFNENHASLQQGFGGTLDQLQDFLAQ